MKRLFVDPIDVLFFRSERPFTAIESHVAKLGIITPQTFEGAIKSKLFFEFCEENGLLPLDFQRNAVNCETEEQFIRKINEKISNNNELRQVLELIGHPAINSKPKLMVLGAFFAKRDKLIEFFPTPNDIFKEDKENGQYLKGYISTKIKFPQKDLSVIISRKHSKVKNVKGFIEFNELIKYLFGNAPKIKKFNYKNKQLLNPYLKETRSGIQIEKYTKRTVEGALYTANFLRLLRGWGFIIWLEFQNNGFSELLRLGGEGKGAYFKTIKERDITKELKQSELIKRINKEKRFKLYIATPSYLNGCVPPKNELEGILGVKIKLIGALPEYPVYIGGFDFAMNKEKPLRRWISAGAVYYYEFKEEGVINENISLPIKICKNNIEMRCAFIGRW